MSQDRSADQGQHATGEKFGQEIYEKARAPQPCPTQLPIPDVARFAPAEWLRERPVKEAHRESGATNNFRRRCIFGDFSAERLDAAGALEICAPPQHGLTLGESTTEAVDDVLPA